MGLTGVKLHPTFYVGVSKDISKRFSFCCAKKLAKCRLNLERLVAWIYFGEYPVESIHFGISEFEETAVSSKNKDTFCVYILCLSLSWGTRGQAGDYSNMCTVNPLHSYE